MAAGALGLKLGSDSFVVSLLAGALSIDQLSVRAVTGETNLAILASGTFERALHTVWIKQVVIVAIPTLADRWRLSLQAQALDTALVLLA